MDLGTNKNSLLASLHQQAVLSFSWQLAVDFTESILKSNRKPIATVTFCHNKGGSVINPPRVEKSV